MIFSFSKPHIANTFSPRLGCLRATKLLYGEGKVESLKLSFLRQYPDGRDMLHKQFVFLVGVVLTLHLWLIGMAPARATGIYDIPSLASGEATPILDQATVLSRVTRSELVSQLDQLAKTTGNEVHLVTIHRLDYGETIDTFADQLFNKWFPTLETQAHQVLLVLDNVTNSAAIRVGEAAKPLLSDEAAQSVAQETVMVPLRNGNKYNQAFLAASARLIAILSGEPDPGPPVVETNIQTEGTFAKAEETNDRSATILVVVLLVVATVIPMATYYLYQVMQS
jgi:uncharacterized protein